MTPQLQQAIKLLALSNLEIETFIGEALDANPLLEIGTPVEAPDAPAERQTSLESSPVDQLIGEGFGAEDRPLDIDAGALDVDRDTGDTTKEAPPSPAKAASRAPTMARPRAARAARPRPSTSMATSTPRWPSICTPRSARN
jgi:DNA-directed RNA polymerase specialized sigma54-like protein